MSSNLLLFFFSTAQQPLVGQGLLIIGVLRSRSVRHIWTSNPPDAETSTMTTHNTHKRQTFMHLVGFHAAFPANERPHTHALDSAATGNGFIQFSETYFSSFLPSSYLLAYLLHGAESFLRS